MDKQKLAELALAVVVLFFGVLIAINLANIDEANTATFTSVMFSRRQATTPLLRIVDEIKEGTYGKSYVSYPQFVRGPLELNNAVVNLVASALASHEKIADASWHARVAVAPSVDGSALTPSSSDKLPIHIYFEPAEISAGRISFLLRIVEVTGGVHDSEEVKTFNYDIHGHRMLSIADMFPNNPNYLDQLSGYSYDSLKQQLSSKFSAKLSDAALKWLKAGTTAGANNFREFTVDHGVLTLYFSQYQVAAYEHGVPFVRYQL